MILDPRWLHVEVLFVTEPHSAADIVRDDKTEIAGAAVAVK